MKQKYAKDIDEAKIQADMITQFTNDISMEFGADKCAYLYIESGKRKSLGDTIDIKVTPTNTWVRTRQWDLPHH